MPFYDYQCQSCGHIYDDRAHFDDYDMKSCPHECGKTGKRLPSLPAPAHGQTLPSRGKGSSTKVRDDKLKEEFKKETE